jgi:hypothetical protein
MKLKNNNSKVMAFQSYFILFVFIYIFFFGILDKKNTKFVLQSGNLLLLFFKFDCLERERFEPFFRL